MLDADGTIIRRAMDDAVGNSILEPITQDSFWKDLAAVGSAGEGRSRAQERRHRVADGPDRRSSARRP